MTGDDFELQQGGGVAARLGDAEVEALHASALNDAFIDGVLSEPIPEQAEQYTDEYPAASL